jgi:hypothetical protein
MELWNGGDLAIATPFLQAAAKSYAVTLLAKPVAKDLKARFWPEVKVIPFTGDSVHGSLDSVQRQVSRLVVAVAGHVRLAPPVGR